MKLPPSFKSAKAICLAAVAIATAIASSVAPSQAEQPVAFFRPNLSPNTTHFFFEKSNTAFTVRDSCDAVQKLFGNTQFRSNTFAAFPPGRLLGNLGCNSEIPGFTSPAFGSNAGVIQVNGDVFFIKSDAFFTAMKIKPTKLTEQQGKDFIAQNPRINNNVVLELGPPPPPFTPPAPLRRLLVLRPDSFASEIIQAPGKPELVIFPNMNQSFTSGCQAVRNLWSKITTKQVTVKDYEAVQRRNVIGELYCNQPTKVKGYTSPAFSPHAGVIVTNGKPFVVRSGEVFNAMNVDLIRLSEEEGQKFIDRNRSIIDSAVITPNNR
jgi:hypothetical protein